MKLTNLSPLWTRQRHKEELRRLKEGKGHKSDGWRAVGWMREVIIGDGSRLAAGWDFSHLAIHLPDTQRCGE